MIQSVIRKHKLRNDSFPDNGKSEWTQCHESVSRTALTKNFGANDHVRGDRNTPTWGAKRML